MADDPRRRAEDHCRLLDEEVIDDCFQSSRPNGVKLCERVVVGVRSPGGVGDGFDRLLILQDDTSDSSHRNRKDRGDVDASRSYRISAL